jgi:hypothetical protein
MKPAGTFPALLEAYFVDRLMRQRQVSHHTLASYRDTFCLVLEYARRHLGKAPSGLVLPDLDTPFLGAFLDHLEHERGNSTRSRNVRLAAIHSFFRYAGDAAKMTARGMAANIEAIGITAEACGVLVYPGNETAHLRRHRAEITARILRRDEIERDKVRPGFDERLGGVAGVLGRSDQPVAAVDEDEDRGVGTVGLVNVEPLDLGRPVGDALRCAYTGAHGVCWRQGAARPGRSAARRCCGGPIRDSSANAGAEAMAAAAASIVRRLMRPRPTRI